MLDQETGRLVRRARRRDPDSFTELMQFYMKDMYKVALAILMNDEDAADAIQDTILTCWEKIDSLKKVMYFKTWMTRILINKCYDIRKKRMETTGLEEIAEPMTCDEYNLELKEAFSLLDEKYRIIMILYYSQGYTVNDIAEVLHMPVSTVQTRMQRGREKVKQYYNEE